jgi:hypothetical protein
MDDGASDSECAPRRQLLPKGHLLPRSAYDSDFSSAGPGHCSTVSASLGADDMGDLIDGEVETDGEAARAMLFRVS